MHGVAPATPNVKARNVKQRAVRAAVVPMHPLRMVVPGAPQPTVSTPLREPYVLKHHGAPPAQELEAARSVA